MHATTVKIRKFTFMDVECEESKSCLQSLRSELETKREKWVSLQVEWAPSFERETLEEIPKVEKPTYLKHVMGGSLHQHIPTRSKCMFEAAVGKMTEKQSPRQLESLEQIVRLPDTSRGSTLEGDKFSVELSCQNQSGRQYTCMPEFSRFLLHLAGEWDLSVGTDPVRYIEEHQTGPRLANTYNDRLIQ